MARIFIGVAWPYANGPQHMGHLAGNSLPADIFARYHRLAGDEVLMVSGSDMHGTPTTVSAEAQGISPEEVATANHRLHETSFRQLGISFDLYTHTHTPWHARSVQDLFVRLLQAGYMERRSEDSPYCPKHRRFLPDRYLQGTCPHCGSPSARGDECDNCARVLEPKELKSPACKLCGTPAEFRPSEHFYFLLPKLLEPLRTYHATVRQHWRPSVRAFTENYVAGGLKARAITRDITWGVPLPLDGYDGKRFYVWFEAVMGYLTASQEWALHQGEPTRWHRFWDAGEDVRAYYFMGKDNITFHTVFWPAILLGLGGLQLPYDVPANEFMVIGGGKISKSRSSADTPVWLPDLLARYDPDLIRFYGAYHMPQNHDTEYVFEEMLQDNDQILADQWGNLVHRILSFAAAQFGGKVPLPPAGWETSKGPVGARIRSTVETYRGHLEACRFKEGLDVALELVREGNRSFHEAKPWAATPDAKAQAVYEGIWTVQAAAVLLAPYLPFSSEKVAQALGNPSLLNPGGFSQAALPPTPGATLGPLKPLFTKLLVAPTAAKASPPAATPSAKAPPVLDIRAGRVVDVQEHPKADKLYVITLDLGDPTPRTIVAGLRALYKKEELVGRTVAVLANLEPRPLRGVVSQGMILAAEAGETVAVLEVAGPVTPGARLVGHDPAPPTIAYDDFARARLVTASVLPPATDAKVRLDAGQGPVEATLDLPAPATVIVRTDRDEPNSPEALRFEPGIYLVPGRPLPPGAKVR